MDHAIKNAKFINGIKTRSSSIGSTGKFIVRTAGFAAIALLVVKNFAINAKAGEKPSSIPVGTEKQVDIAWRVGDIPKHVFKEIRNKKNVDPFTLKEKEVKEVA